MEKEAQSARVDFTAKVVSMPLYAGARVALLGLTQEDIFPLQSAAIVRTMTLRTFDDVTRAVQWLAESEV